MRPSHGLSGTPEFRVWTDMQTRCYNKNTKHYRYYGAKGVIVCERWLKFENFLADMGQRPSAHHSIDRLDSEGNYAPENCRWATAAEQSDNRGNTIRITLDGVTKTLTEWCKERGVKRGSAWLRYKEGERGEALFHPRCEHITHNGVTDTVSGWSKRTGLKPTTIVMRLKREWPVEEALTKGATPCAS